MSPEDALKNISSKLKNKIRFAQIAAARELAQLIPELIKIRTRNAEEGTNGKLKGLDKNTVKYRERYSENLHPETSPSTSNLTATGQLLDSITGRNVGSKIISEAKGRRKRELSGSKSKMKNSEVLKEVEKNGRVFHELNAKDKEEITKVAAEIIKEELSSVT